MLATLLYDTLYTNHCLLGEWTFSTDTPSFYLGIEGVLDAAPTLCHCVPVLVGCPLYNEASVLADLKHCSSTAVVRDYPYYMRLFLIRFARFWLQRYKKNCRLSHKRTKICNMMMQKNSFLLCFSVFVPYAFTVSFTSSIFVVFILMILNVKLPSMVMISFTFGKF